MVFLDMATSLDGFICGPDGEDWGLHDWYFAPSAESRKVVEELPEIIGAMLLGRRSYAVGEGQDGYEGGPYKVPHFVLTHEAREPQGLVTFVTEGLEVALARAKAAAGDRAVCVAGGADVAQQCLRAGLLDEIRLHVVSKVFGTGVRLFGEVGTKPVALERTHVVQGEGVTHLRFRVVGAG